MRDFIKPSITLFIVCLIVSVALAFTHSITQGKIEERAKLDAENARKEVLSDAKTFKLIDNLEAITGEKPELSMVKEAYTGLDNDEEKGFVFVVVNNGYGGDVNITVGVDKTGKLTGVKIGDNNETPGLGKKAADKPFISQFTGLAPEGPLSVVKGKSNKPEEIEAISGATITSRAVTNAVQAALDVSKKLIDKEGSQK